MADSLKISHRYHALDNLRVTAMLLGLVTHGVLPYTATGIVEFPIRDCTRHPAADAAYFAVHDFRMQLFFLLAGFAGAALAAKRGIDGLVRNRLARVAVPLALAAVVICPLMHLSFAAHTATRGIDWHPAGVGGWVGPNFHLWFLYYLLLCCAPLVALLAAAPRIPARAVRAADDAVRWFIGRRWKLPALAAVAVPVLWDMPNWWIDTPRGWTPDSTICVYYLGFFLAGAILFRHRDALSGVGRRWRLQLAVANLIVLPAMLKLTVSGNWAEEAIPGQLPAWLAAWKAGAIFLGGLYTWLTIAALLGMFQRYFAQTTPAWAYLSGASYWCYLAGFPVQTALQVWLAPQPIPIVVEFLLVNALTFAILLASYELCVRHTWVGLLLNGKRPERNPPVEPVVVFARVAVPEYPPAPEPRTSRVAPTVRRAAAPPPSAGSRRHRPVAGPAVESRR